jgi:hypothetical protein
VDTRLFGHKRVPLPPAINNTWILSDIYYHPL